MKDCLKDSATCELTPELALPLLICAWFLKCLVYELDFCLFRTVFLQATQVVKIKFEIVKRSSSKIKFKNHFLWTWDFKNQVQINRGSGWEFFIFVFFLLCLKKWKIIKERTWNPTIFSISRLLKLKLNWPENLKTIDLSVLSIGTN